MTSLSLVVERDRIGSISVSQEATPECEETLTRMTSLIVYRSRRSCISVPAAFKPAPSRRDAGNEAVDGIVTYAMTTVWSSQLTNISTTPDSM